MAAIKPADIDAFVARPDPARPVVLVFGPDAGLVSERVNALIKSSVDDANAPFALARLEAEDLAAEPSRLVEEAQTIPLFGGRRAVWVKAGGRNIAPAVEALLALPAIECRVVIEAGDLRRNAPLRSLCEKAKNAAALPCYADNERDRERLIDSEMREAGLKLAPDARAMLVPLLGGDRPGPVSILFAVQRQVAQLHKWRTAIEAGSGFSLDAAQPPVNFRRKDAIAAALRLWSAARLLVAMSELAEAVLQSRRNADLADTIAERALLAIAANVRRSAA